MIQNNQVQCYRFAMLVNNYYKLSAPKRENSSLHYLEIKYKVTIT